VAWWWRALLEALVEKKVLIVENDALTRDLLAKEFTCHGFRVLSTDDGTNALLQLGISQPNAIIVSTCLPGLDGWETLRRARELSSVPIIAIVAKEDETARIESLRQGADYSVTKPLSAREVHARVCALLRRTQAVS
jgi:DNA-binding response OmpR family regulator